MATETTKKKDQVGKKTTTTKKLTDEKKGEGGEKATDTKKSFDLNKGAIDSIITLNRLSTNFVNRLVQISEVLSKKRLSGKEAMKARMILNTAKNDIKLFSDINNSKEISLVLKGLGLGTHYYKDEAEKIKEGEKSAEVKK